VGKSTLLFLHGAGLASGETLPSYIVYRCKAALQHLVLE